MTVKIDPDTNSVIEFSAKNVETWDCGPDLGDVIGHDNYIKGPKAGKAIPFRSWGEYQVSGPAVCEDYVTEIGFDWGCPGFADKLKSIACDDDTELKIRFSYVEPP